MIRLRFRIDKVSSNKISKKLSRDSDYLKTAVGSFRFESIIFYANVLISISIEPGGPGGARGARNEGVVLLFQERQLTGTSLKTLASVRETSNPVK